MYLNKLNHDEKCSFIKLAEIISEVDGNKCLKEELVINEYKREVGFDKDFILPLKDLDEIINSFENSSITVKKIILFEILILVYSDSDFCGEEKRVINILIASFNINKEEYEQFIEITNNILLNLSKANNLIFKALV